MAIITATELATYRGIEDNEDQERLTVAAAAACSAIEEWCGRIFDQTDTDDASPKTFRPDDQCRLRVPDFWSTTGLIVKTDDNDDGAFETTWTLDTDYIVEAPVTPTTRPYNEIRGLGTRLFPVWNRRRSVQVTAAWGWSAVPGPVKQAALILASKLLFRRNSPEGVAGGFSEFGAIRISRFEDPDVITQLAPYRTGERAVLIG